MWTDAELATIELDIEQANKSFTKKLSEKLLSFVERWGDWNSSGLYDGVYEYRLHPDRLVDLGDGKVCIGVETKPGHEKGTYIPGVDPDPIPLRVGVRSALGSGRIIEWTDVESMQISLDKLRTLVSAFDKTGEVATAV